MMVEKRMKTRNLHDILRSRTVTVCVAKMFACVNGVDCTYVNPRKPIVEFMVTHVVERVVSAIVECWVTTIRKIRVPSADVAHRRTSVAGWMILMSIQI